MKRSERDIDKLSKSEKGRKKRGKKRGMKEGKHNQLLR